MPYDGRADLMSYLPFYYTENEEMTRLTDAENPEIDVLWDEVRETRDNQFILTSENWRIRQWEKLLRLRPDYAVQSLDYRKDVVIMRLSVRLPLTYRWLVSYTSDIVGSENFTIYLNHNEYSLMIKLFEEPDIVIEFYKHIRRLIPANLGLYFRHVQVQHTVSPYIGAYIARDTAKIRIPTRTVEDRAIASSTCYIGSGMFDFTRIRISTAPLRELA